MGCIRSSGLYQRSPVSDLNAKPVAFLDLSHFSSISPVTRSHPLWCHPGPHARGSPTSLGEVAAGHQRLVSTWTDGWMDGMDRQPSSWMLSPTKLMGSSGLSERGNIGKLLFSSFIFKRREIFECYCGAIAMARLTNSVG